MDNQWLLMQIEQLFGKHRLTVAEALIDSKLVTVSKLNRWISEKTNDEYMIKQIVILRYEFLKGFGIVPKEPK